MNDYKFPLYSLPAWVTGDAERIFRQDGDSLMDDSITKTIQNLRNVIKL